MIVELASNFIVEHSYIFGGLVACGVFIFLVKNRGAQKPTLQVFGEQFVRPRTRLIVDKKARDEVLKQRFKESKVPDNLDVIVIGSGIGGLSAAVLLSRVGKKVLVLEQHDVAGGCCHTFTEKGFEFDTGIHYVGEMDGKSWSSVLMDQLTEGQVEWVPMDEEYDEVVLGENGKVKKFPMKSGPNDEYFEQLKKLFPDNKADVEKFQTIMMKVVKKALAPYVIKFMPLGFATMLVKYGIYRFMFRDYFSYAEQTVKEVLDSITDNPDLKAAISYICGDYGVFPHEAPFSVHVNMIQHFRKGAYYVLGGSSEIPFQMIQIIERNGGRVLVQAPVTKILTNENEEVIGVRVHKSSGSVDVMAKMVVSDAGAINTFTKLLPKEIADKSPIYPVMERIGSSKSFLQAYVGLDGSAEDLGLKAQNTWAYLSNDLDTILSSYMNLSFDDLETTKLPMLFISFPSAKDPSWEERYPGKSVALIITIAEWEWFSEWKDEKVRHRGERYQQTKTALGNQMWKQCCELFPQLDGKMEYLEVGTPVSSNYYLAAPHGEPYGLELSKDRISLDSCLNLRPETGIPGLFLTGQDPCTSGMFGAVMGAIICASKILDENLHSQVMKLHKTLSAKKQKKA